jgi:hypothetical protein
MTFAKTKAQRFCRWAFVYVYGVVGGEALLDEPVPPV